MAIKANGLWGGVIYKPGTLIGAAESIVLKMTCTEDVDEFIVLHVGWRYQQRLIPEEDPHEGPVGDIHESQLLCIINIYEAGKWCASKFCGHNIHM